jgi:hypothetical protein
MNSGKGKIDLFKKNEYEGKKSLSDRIACNHLKRKKIDEKCRLI